MLKITLPCTLPIGSTDPVAEGTEAAPKKKKKKKKKSETEDAENEYKDAPMDTNETGEDEVFDGNENDEGRRFEYPNAKP